MAGHSIRQGGAPERRGTAGAADIDPPAPAGSGALNAPANPINSSRAIFTGPLLLWLSLQVGALAVAAARVPLAAEYPQAAEFQAPRVLLVVQVISVAFLFPVFCRGWRATVVTAASGMVMLLFAAALGARTWVSIVLAAGYVALWIATASLWNSLACGRRSGMLMVAIAGCITAGGPLLWYLGADLGSQRVGGAEWSLGPAWAVIKDVDHPAGFGWITLAIMCGGALALRFFLRKSHPSYRNTI